MQDRSEFSLFSDSLSTVGATGHFCGVIFVSIKTQQMLYKDELNERI